MRTRVSLDRSLVERVDRRGGKRNRCEFISEAIGRALEDERRWDDIEASFGALAAHPHEWDDDPGGWVREQRRNDPVRVG